MTTPAAASFREHVLWIVLGIVVAAFFAIEVFLLSSVVDAVKDLNGRMWELECERKR